MLDSAADRLVEDMHSDTFFELCAAHSGSLKRLHDTFESIDDNSENGAVHEALRDEKAQRQRLFSFPISTLDCIKLKVDKAREVNSQLEPLTADELTSLVFSIHIQTSYD